MHELFLASRIFKIMFYSERLCLHHFFGVFGSKLIGLSVFGENLYASQSRIRIHEFTEGYEWYWMICCVVFSFCLSSGYSKPLYLAGLKTHPINLGVFTPFLRIDWKNIENHKHTLLGFESAWWFLSPFEGLFCPFWPKSRQRFFHDFDAPKSTFGQQQLSI